MFEVGDLIKRKQIDSRRTRSHCVVVNRDENNYTIYNNSLQSIRLIAIPVVEGLYSKVV